MKNHESRIRIRPWTLINNAVKKSWSQPVLRIRIHRIHMFLGLLDPDPLVRGMNPDPDPLVRGMNPDPDPALDPDPSIIKQI